MSFGARLTAAMRDHDVSQNDLARHLGVSHAAVYNWLADRFVPRGKRLQAIAQALDVSETHLLTGDHGNVTVANGTQGEDTHYRELPRDVPVLGVAHGGKGGAFQMGGTVDFVRRLPGCSRDTYALYVHGDSMAPWRPPGDLIYVNPTRPVTIGCHVVVTVLDEASGEDVSFVKRLVRRTHRTLQLEQYNPRQAVDLPTRLVRSVHRVMEWGEVLGM